MVTEQPSFGSPHLDRVLKWRVAWRSLGLRVDMRGGSASTAAVAPAPAPPTTAATLPSPAPVAAAPTPAPVPPAPQPAVVVASASDSTSTTTADWACIRDHESGGNYSDDTGNGYSGAYQFMPSTWNEAVSGAGYPQYANGEAYQAPAAVQNAAALWLYDRDGWAPWSTRYVCGL